MTLISAEHLSKIYRRGNEDVKALNDVSLQIERGETVAVVGPSGSGKTTLVNILGCLDNPTAGTLTVDGTTIFKDGNTLSEKKLTLIRRKLFGYVFQKFFLIPTLTVRENILLPSVFDADFAADDKRAAELAEMLGVAHRLNHLPAELSGGEMQRVAIARALIGKPQVLVADEPTGNLDSKTSDEIMLFLQKLNRERGITIVLVTHEPDVAAYAQRLVRIVDGQIAYDGAVKAYMEGNRD